MNIRNMTIAAAAVASIAFAGAAQARDQIQIVGSSTVFPFSTLVAEQFGKTTEFKTPVVESTGSGGGMKLFCAGIGLEHPDITNASRRIKKSEFEKCTAAGITITEVKIGYDGIVIANAKSADQFELTRQQLFLALAAQVPNEENVLVKNPYTKWSEIDPSLPDLEIEVLGPPPTSGTRDAFVELVMRKGARKFDFLNDLRGQDKKAFRAISDTMREDGRFIEAGENDNLMVQKVEANPAALAIFGFSFLEENRDKVQGSIVEGTQPTFDSIASGDYPVSRSLYFYVKNEHVGVVPGIKEFVAEFVAEKAIGEEGYAIDKGLIPLPDADREAMRENALNLAPLSM
ncbi:phosphate ABC transporter substrate-binding protein [Pyruvatibacter mobilis]|jgi:phosphate transport system substrate-binding protein|uniref:Phosphate ABC transporter substrate-binding protein n=1 Tax=Pyruvatibacter mobilis TaxID=1712261 RepID=A0A845Q8M9_9HYPH|nr:PstS family phosphate ABC transporter substrate-binding protein [Pyruvatibacter mobilis]NBG94804.1 phosphate ABC transporter substrate-binding protein [Pyruvatibacter mobilis]GGD20220.1 phosphate ABC transporter substrate-binding protein [Pyruvatibacter mobilis]